ncbi:FAD/NAD(P)-binding domain-containing protein [Trichoderma sp. SZMC 28012]
MDGKGDRPSFDIAIVGAGVVGVHVAIGLLDRGIPFTIYEQSAELTEMGAGITITSTIAQSLTALHPEATQYLLKVSKLMSNINLVNGSRDDLSLRPSDQLYDLVISPFELHAAHRAKLVEGLLQLIPKERIKLGKRIESIVERGGDEKLLLQFADGTTAEADAVIGCDGIKSRVRQIVGGSDNPSSFAHYSNMSAYRGLITMDKATAALGQLVKDPVWYLGQGASMVTYAILGPGGIPFLNVVAYVHDEQDSLSLDSLVSEGNKEDVEAAFSHFGSSVKDVIKALPDKLNRWALFDSYAHPLPSYAYGRTVLAGDAAHPSTPHIGSGAGMGIEEALILAELLKSATERLGASEGSTSRRKLLEAAFKAYSDIRRPRTQWIVAQSRTIGIMSQGRHKEMGTDFDNYGIYLREKIGKLQAYDWKDSIRQAIDQFERELGASV